MIVIAAVALSTAAMAVVDPMDEVKTTVNQVLQIVTDPGYKSATAERRGKLRQVIAPRFDFGDMARSALGYHWRELSQQQRDQFVNLFTDFLQAAYMGKIEGYKGQKIEYVKELKNGPNDAQVDTRIVQPGNQPVPINYKMRLNGDTWKVYDVTIDQISLVGNYRNQFNRVINQKGFNALIDAIKQKLGQIDQKSAGQDCCRSA